jgi:NADH dehydrogenase
MTAGGVVLVTGGTGFVGQRVVHALRAEERAVRCLVRDRGRAARLEAWGCELATGDVADAATVREAVAGCETVVHLVAIIQGSPKDFQRVMIDGTRNVVEAARAAESRRFFLMSALGVSEQTRELTPYYRAKWTMEEIVRESGLEYVILRPSFVFGPGGGAITEFSRLVRFLPAIPVVGSGERRLQPIFVDDVAAAVARSIDLPEAANRTFELGGPEAVTWNELWDRLTTALGKKRRKVHLPVGLLRAQAAVLEKLPKPLVTRDQLTMLEAGDNVCDEKPAAELFGIELTSLDEQLERSVR